MDNLIKTFIYDTTDSTNIRAREYIISGEELPALFVADCQTEGRGRKGKNFYSPSGSGLYMSLALPYTKSIKNNVTLTSATAVALLHVLKNWTDKRLEIKWVNDILADGKKVSGILCETVADPDTMEIRAVIIGIGINITTNSFPPELDGIVTSLGDIVIDRTSLVKEITRELIRILEVSPASVINEYKSNSAVLGKDIYYIKNNIRYDGKVLNILKDGSLKVLKNDNTEDILSSGEITLRIN